MSECDRAQLNIDLVIELCEQDRLSELGLSLEDAHPADLASMIEALPRDMRAPVWEQLSSSLYGDVLLELSEEVRVDLMAQLDIDALRLVTRDVDGDDLPDILEPLPEETSRQLMLTLDVHIREQVTTSLSFDEEDAGRYMRSDVISVRPDVTLEVILRYLRRREDLPDHTDRLMVLDRGGRFLGTLALSQLLVRDPEVEVGSVMEQGGDFVYADEHEDEVAKLFERHNLISVPVLDRQRMLVGRITVDDAVDIIREQADDAMLNPVGLDSESDLFGPVGRSVGQRTLWLGINLLTAALASWVIGRFVDVLEQVVALAVLMPIVASMGGIAGSQTLTLTVRGLAIGQLSASNLNSLMKKEVAIGLVNGLLWALIVGSLALAWFHDQGLGLVIASAVMINLIVASFAGVAIPVMLKRCGSDPALSGAVVLTTVTDVVGFLSFLGLATLFLL